MTRAAGIRSALVLLSLATGLAGLTSAAPPQRIVSLIPAVTEMLFAMDAGPRVIGVSSYDRHPPEVDTRTKVGALLDPDLERILSLRPDLVAIYETQTDLRTQLTRAGVAVFEYRFATIDDIYATLRALGRRLELRDEAEREVARLQRRLDEVRRRVSGRPRPRTLLVFGREPGAIRSVQASGGYGFLDELLQIAGGANVFADQSRPLVQASAETILASAPEVIVELRYDRTMTSAEIEAAIGSWQALPGVPAVRTGRVYVLSGDGLVVPGPRIGDTAARLAAVLH
jgi:iron complex transport system substrate-binding protein